MFTHNLVKKTAAAAKETILDAASLLAEAVLGPPAAARAACPPGGTPCGDWYGACNTDCGIMKRRYGWIICYPGGGFCFEPKNCVYC